MNGEPGDGVNASIEEKNKVRVPRGPLEQVKHSFAHHPPKEDQPERYASLRRYGTSLAEEILRRVPDSRERSLALTKVEEAVMWANKGIAVNE